MRTILLFTIVMQAAAAGAAAQQHTLFLANGDQLTGRLREIAKAGWVFAFSGANVTVPVARVVGLETEEPVGLRLADGSIVAARVAPSGDALALRLADGTVRVVAPSELAAVGPADDLGKLRRRRGLVGFLLEQWGVTGSLGFSDKRGNSRARGLSVGAQFTRRSERARVDLGASATREDSEGPSGELETTVSKGHQFFQVDLYVSPRLFLTAGTRQEQDRFQDIALRSTYSAGMGVQAVQTASTDLRFNLLAGLRREDFISAGATSTAIVGLAAGFKQNVGPAVLNWRVTWDPRAQDFRDYRFVSNSSITARLYRGLGIRFAVLEEYNSRPRPGVTHNDLLTTTTLTYSIGR